MSIIEKLGITQGPWKRSVSSLQSEERIGATCYIADQKIGYYGNTEEEIKRSVNDLNLCAAAPEMLEALISWCAWVEDSGDYEAEPNFVSVIEKACHPLKWEEIKELIK
ncbi:MAG: hypothetical protein GY804_03015 [Alphaproteobacteria bacterium]|nr:hypothetical protein [Alphaproteobacteria bacterium]